MSGCLLWRSDTAVCLAPVKQGVVLRGFDMAMSAYWLEILCVSVYSISLDACFEQGIYISEQMI